MRSDESAPRHSNLSLLLVPTGAPGLKVQVTDAIGMKGAPTTDTIMDEVSIPVENIVGGRQGWNRGREMLTSVALNVEKLEVAAMVLGIAEAAAADAWEYAQQRIQFGKVVSSFQAVRHRLADMRPELLAIDAQEIAGAYGLTRDFDFERYVRDMLIMPIAGGSSNIQRNNITQMIRWPSELCSGGAQAPASGEDQTRLVHGLLSGRHSTEGQFE